MGDVRRENGKLRICLFREIMSRLPDRERSAYLLYRVYNPLLFFFVLRFLSFIMHVGDFFF